jgi:hypothetical protein
MLRIRLQCDIIEQFKASNGETLLLEFCPEGLPTGSTDFEIG